MKYGSGKNWYVLQVRSKAERLVEMGLHKKHFEVLNPSYHDLSTRKDRRKVLVKPIFKGYMFIRTSLDPECHLEIVKTPGVVDILKSESGPTPVPEDQIKNVLLLEKHVGDFFFGNRFDIGDAVFVREGPLTGLRGVIDRLDKKKLYIHIDAIPGSVLIEVKSHQVRLEKDSVYSLVKDR